MKFSQDGYTVSIQHNWEREREFWVYSIIRNESGEMLYRGFSKNALEAIETVEKRIQSLGMRNSD